MWHHALRNPPPLNDLGDSEYLLCLEVGHTTPFVGYFGGGCWRLAHFMGTDSPRDVTHWMQLPEAPLTDEALVYKEYPNATCVRVKELAGSVLPVEMFRIVDQHEVYADPIGELQMSPSAAWESAASKL